MPTSLPPYLLVHVEFLWTFSCISLKYELINKDHQILEKTFNIKDRDKTTTPKGKKKYVEMSCSGATRVPKKKKAYTSMYLHYRQEYLQLTFL